MAGVNEGVIDCVSVTFESFGDVLSKLFQIATRLIRSRDSHRAPDRRNAGVGSGFDRGHACLSRLSIKIAHLSQCAKLSPCGHGSETRATKAYIGLLRNHGKSCGHMGKCWSGRFFGEIVPDTAE